MHGFRYISLINMAALLYTSVLYIVELPEYYNYFINEANISAAYLDWNIFSGFTIAIFGYYCQINLLPIYKEMQRPSYDRLKKMINRSTLIDLFFYLNLSITTFLSTFDHTTPIFLERINLPGMEHHYSLTVAIIAIFLSILVTVPLSF